MKQKKEPIKVISMYSTFISNKNGTEKLGRNIYYKNKRGRKITTAVSLPAKANNLARLRAVDEKGIPLKIHLSKGNGHDATIAP